MSVGDEIFPREGDVSYVQTQWARGWVYAVVGFGAAARMLTERRAEMHASVDQIGLAVFYLQRHRVELVLKQTLADLGEDAVTIIGLGHDLLRLWLRLGSIVEASSKDDWVTLQAEHGAFIVVIHEADERSFSYRYPVDTSGAESRRAPFINLEALEAHAQKLESGLSGYLDWASEMRRYEPDSE